MALFHGWIVVAATHVALFVAFGVGYSFAAFFTAFQEEFNASRGEVALVFSIFGFLYFLVGAFTGIIADRVGPRRVCIAGMLLLCLALIATSRATTIEQLYLAYSVGIGLAVGFVYVPSVSAVQPWFVRRRGLATGLTVAGIGLGTLLGPVIGVWLIALVGWRHTYELFAIVGLVLGVGAAFFIDNAPARRGLFPDDEKQDPGRPSPRQVPPGLTLRQAVRTRAFWLLYAALLSCGIGLFVPMVHLAPYAQDHGLSAETGALLTGLIGLGSMIGRFALAGIGDRLPRATLLGLLFIGMGAALLIWLMSAGVFPLAISAVLFGTCYGGMVAVAPAITMDYFGARNVAGIIGIIYTGPGIGVGIGPWLAGVSYDLYGSYTLPIAGSIIFMVFAVGAAALLTREQTLHL
ncbi:MAG: MFS transporter [Burkholderiales bacterium]